MDSILDADGLPPLLVVTLRMDGRTQSFVSLWKGRLPLGKHAFVAIILLLQL